MRAAVGSIGDVGSNGDPTLHASSSIPAAATFLKCRDPLCGFQTHGAPLRDDRTVRRVPELDRVNLEVLVNVARLADQHVGRHRHVLRADKSTGASFSDFQGDIDIITHAGGFVNSSTQKDCLLTNGGISAK